MMSDSMKGESGDPRVPSSGGAQADEPLYPLVFTPIFKERVWGGRHLETFYGKALPREPNASKEAPTFGESWEIADLKEGTSVIANGPLAGRDLRWLMERRSEDILGSAASCDGRFPLLVKILDARQRLSVQVHPPADVAPALGGESKTEMWYVTEVEPEADLFVGLRAGTTRGGFQEKLNDGTVADLIHRIPVRPGDAMFVPSGRIHAIGAGNVIFEIQENSDTTYRVFDWNRTGSDGNPRELHIDEAMGCIDFEDFEPKLVERRESKLLGFESQLLVDCPSFQTHEVALTDGAISLPSGRPIVIGCVSGAFQIRFSGSVSTLAPGQFALSPASLEGVELVGSNAKALLSLPGDRNDKGARTEEARASQTAFSGTATARVANRPTSQKASRRSSEIRRPNFRRRAYQLRLGWALSLLSILKRDQWFRYTLLASLLVGGFAMATLPKIWNVTPKGVYPKSHVSLLDLFQAWSLRNTALQAEERNDYENALRAWHMALANAPTNKRNLRDYLDFEIQRSKALATEPNIVALKQADFLLELSRTNQSDLDRFTKLLSLSPFDDLTLSVLESVDELTVAQSRERLKATFEAGAFDEFETLWGSAESAVTADPVLELYRQGYLAIARTGSRRTAALEALEGAIQDRPNVTIPAAESLRIAGYHLGDVSRYEQAVSILEGEKGPRLEWRLGLWEVLIRVGDRARALSEIQENALPPASLKDIERFVRLYRELGRGADILPLLEDNRNRFRRSVGYWTLLGNERIRQENWDALIQLSVEMGVIQLERPEFAPVSRYYDGVAQYELGARGKALRKFESMLQFSEVFQRIPSRHALRMVHEINSRGFASVANTLAGWLENSLSNVARYWTERALIGYNLGDSDTMVNAALAAWEISKESDSNWQSTETGRMTANNYAGALLLARKLPAKALTLTRYLYSRNPESIMTMLNHASALVQNYRLDESERLLFKLRNRADRLNLSQRLDLKLIELQHAVASGSWDEARRVSRWLDEHSMAPLQRELFEDENARLAVSSGNL